jgi:hypothetical protein
MTTTVIKSEVERQDDLKYDQYLFEIFRNDHIENQVQRMMEYSDHDQPINHANPLQIYLL